MRRWARSAYRALLVAVVGSSLLGANPARAQDDGASDAATALGGYEGTAAADGVRAYYNPQGLLPIAAPVDMGAPDALATIASGPATYARSSIADPGDLLANPSAVLGLADPNLSGSLPVYPYRVSVSSTLGPPTAEVSPVPGLSARVRADGTGSTAEASMPSVDAPALVTVGSLSARSETAIDGSTVKVHARTALSGVDVLGIVHIDGVITDLTATSTGGAPKLDGGTKVVGASVLGTPVIIDANGLRAAGGVSTANPLVSTVDDLLGQIGLHLTVASPVEMAGASAGQSSAAGLQIDLELSPQTIPSLYQLFDVLPPMDSLVPGLPGIEDILAAARARNLVKLGLGSASVALTATAGADAFVPPADGAVELPTFAAPSDAGLALDAIRPPTPSANRPATPIESTSVGFGEGIGGLALLLLLLQPLLGDRLARWATTMLAPPGASSCPWEGR